MSRQDPEFGIKMIKIKVAEIMLHFINSVEINAHKN